MAEIRIRTTAIAICIYNSTPFQILLTLGVISGTTLAWFDSWLTGLRVLLVISCLVLFHLYAIFRKALSIDPFCFLLTQNHYHPAFSIIVVSDSVTDHALIASYFSASNDCITGWSVPWYHCIRLNRKTKPFHSNKQTNKTWHSLRFPRLVVRLFRQLRDVTGVFNGHYSEMNSGHD